MKRFFTLGLLLVSLAASAQTRRIEQRSHAGAGYARYRGAEGSYGRVAPRKVKVHLESGRDTMVYSWDSLANPNYIYAMDSTSRAQFGPRDAAPKEHISQMGTVTGKIIVTGPH